MREPEKGFGAQLHWQASASWRETEHTMQLQWWPCASLISGSKGSDAFVGTSQNGGKPPKSQRGGERTPLRSPVEAGHQDCAPRGGGAFPRQQKGGANCGAT